jgi:hypothetical protein
MTSTGYPPVAETNAEGTRWLPLTNSRQKVLVDARYYDALSKYRWRLVRGETKPYVASTGHRGYLLHRLLVRAPQGLQVDHINRKTLDNRVENLRKATSSQNQANAGLSRNNTSGYRGVAWDKKSGKWRASFRVREKLRYLGLFANQEDAVRARDWGQIILHAAEFVRPRLPLAPIDPEVLKRIQRVLDRSYRRQMWTEPLK